MSPSLSMLELRQQQHHHLHGRRDSSTSHMEIALPALGHAEYGGGDISPMKAYGGGEHGHRHSSSGMEPILVHFPSRDEDSVHHPHGHSSQALTAPTNAHGGSLVSNPFFVLRCARKAFSKCTFLLPCLTEPDPPAVNMSEHGSIKVHHGSSNRAFYEVSTEFASGVY